MQITRAFTVMIIGGVLLAPPRLAQAQAPEDDGALRQNCVGDYFRFCSSFMPGSVAIRQCFVSNIDRLTPECRGAIHAFDRRHPKPS